MRYLGIDYGTKRVGIAVSDQTGAMAFPETVLKNDETLLEEIVAIITERGIGEIVIGQSLNGDGNPNYVQSEIDTLITDLTLETGLPVHSEPEQYSTQESIQIQGRTELTDASAAAIILNSFLTKRKK